MSITKLACDLRWQSLANCCVACVDMSRWPDSTTLCSQLPTPEQLAASALTDAVERNHYARRKLFQRLFVKQALDCAGSLADVPLRHARDQRPVCDGFNDVSLSFSSSGDLAMAAASTQVTVGVDVELCRNVPDALPLAKRFFSANELASLSALPHSEQSIAFLRLWSAKEACLKAWGTGVVAGLQVFEFSWQESWQLIMVPPPTSLPDWQVSSLNISEGAVSTLATYSSPHARGTHVDKPQLYVDKHRASPPCMS